MSQLLRRHLATILVAMVTAAITAGGPAVAAVIADYAKNADKVDGKHAVGAGASTANRAGKLVATNSAGRLPNSIIAKAPDADRVDGRHAVGAGASTANRAGKLVATNGAGRLPNSIIAKAPDSDTLDGFDSLDFALAGHGHDDLYALAAHNHDDLYAVAAHDHDGQYAVAAHDHDGQYAATAHNHDGQYYTKAQAQARTAANSLTCASGQLLRSVAPDGTPTCDVVAQRPRGFASSSPVNLPATGVDAFRMVTPTFVVPAGVTSCMVTSAIQVQPPANAPNDTMYFRNAVSRNGLNAEDGQYGQYVTNDGSTRKQPSMTRATVIAVNPGQTVAFGAYFGNLGGTWYNAPYSIATSYMC